MSRPSKNISTIPGNGGTAVGFTDPLLYLEHERAITLGHVRELEEAARSITEKGFTARSFESISRVGALLGDMFQKHESLEEQHLFPRLRKINPGMVRAFSEEHRAMRRLFDSLQSLVRDIEGGRIHGTSVGDLLRTIRDIVTLLRRHVIHEGDVLAPLVRRGTGGTVSGNAGDVIDPTDK